MSPPHLYPVPTPPPSHLLVLLGILCKKACVDGGFIAMQCWILEQQRHLRIGEKGGVQAMQYWDIFPTSLLVHLLLVSAPFSRFLFSQVTALTPPPPITKQQVKCSLMLHVVPPMCTTIHATKYNIFSQVVACCLIYMRTQYTLKFQ